MTLGQLQRLLLAADEYAVIPFGFTGAHSWRGVYAEVAFEPAAMVQVKEMRAEVERALTETFRGYKGGDYRYELFTLAHLDDEFGECHDYDWAGVIVGLASAMDA